MNDIVAAQSNPDWWSQLRGIVALSLLPTGTGWDESLPSPVVGASDRLDAAVEHYVRAAFERRVAEAGAVANVVRDETGSFVPAQRASTPSPTM